MKEAGRRIACLAVLGIAAVLGGCSMEKVYEDERMNAVVTESEDGIRELVVYIQVSPAELPEKAKAAVETGERVKEYEVQLSDGIYYGYSSSPDNGTGVYPRVFSSADEIREFLGMNLLTGEIDYPEGEDNFILFYDPLDPSIMIHSASADLADGITVQWDAYLNFSGKNSQSGPGIAGVSEEVRHEEYTAPGGQRADIFFDGTSGQACICVLEQGSLYKWYLDGRPGEMEIQDVETFIDSWKTG